MIKMLSGVQSLKFQNCLEITSGDYSMEIKFFSEPKPCSCPQFVFYFIVIKHYMSEKTYF